MANLEVKSLIEYHYRVGIEKKCDIRPQEFSIKSKNVKYEANGEKYYRLISKDQSGINYKYDINLMKVLMYVGFVLKKKTLNK